MRRILSVAVFLLVVTPICFLILLSFLSRNALESYIESLASEGEPIDPTEIVGKKISKEDNFFEAPILLHFRGISPQGEIPYPWESEESADWRVIPALSSAAKPEVPVPEFFGEFTQSHHFSGLSAPEMLAELDKVTRSRRHSISAIRKAALRPKAWKSYRIEDGFEMPSEELYILGSYQKFLQLRTAVAIENGRSRSAISHLQTDLRISRHLLEYPPLIFQLVSITKLKKSVANIQLGLRESIWTIDELEVIREELRNLRVEAAFLRSLRFERAIGMQLFLNGDESFLRHDSPLGILSNRIRYLNAKKYFEGIEEGILTDEAGNSAIDRLPPLIQLTNFLDQVRSSRTKQILFSTTSEVLPTFQGIMKRCVRTSVALQQAEIAIELELYRQRHSDFPNQLSGLGESIRSALLQDRFSADIMKYATLSDGTYELYSVGLNGTDDSGLLRYDIEEGDWVWRLTLPENFDYELYR